MRTLAIAPALLLTVLVACGPAGRGNGPKTDITVVIQPSGSNLSGIDMSGFEQVGQPLSSGGAVALPDGTAINVAPGVTDGSVTVGLRPSSRGPATGNDVEGSPLSPWIDAAVSTSDFDADPDAPFTIQVPVTPPDEAIGHPGFQLTLVMPDGSTFPMEGSYDPSFGTFSAQLLSLPPRFQFAVTFNENIIRIDSADVPDAVYGRLLVQIQGQHVAIRYHRNPEWLVKDVGSVGVKGSISGDVGDDVRIRVPIGNHVQFGNGIRQGIHGHIANTVRDIIDFGIGHLIPGQVNGHIDTGIIQGICPRAAGTTCATNPDQTNNHKDLRSHLKS